MTAALSTHLACSGPTKQACERTVKTVLQLEQGLDVAHKYLETGGLPFGAWG